MQCLTCKGSGLLEENEICPSCKGNGVLDPCKEYRCMIRNKRQILVAINPELETLNEIQKKQNQTHYKKIYDIEILTDKQKRNVGLIIHTMRKFGEVSIQSLLYNPINNGMYRWKDKTLNGDKVIKHFYAKKGFVHWINENMDGREVITRKEMTNYKGKRVGKSVYCWSNGQRHSWWYLRFKDDSHVRCLYNFGILEAVSVDGMKCKDEKDYIQKCLDIEFRGNKKEIVV